MENFLKVSICIPAYNEGKNIDKILKALLNQVTEKIKINKIVVVSSGSTDNTDVIVTKYCKKFPQISLIKQPKRMGKAMAINAFLKVVNDEVVVIESADTIPRTDTIEKLCVPFLTDKKIGMTGGAPIPINDSDCFIGYIIHAWWWFHRNIPRFGEIIAYRNVLPYISPTTAVDEAYIQAKLIQMEYKIVHIDEAIIQNKGPQTVSDLIKQRRRIFNGHSRLHEEESIRINNMTKSSLHLLLFKFKMYHVKHLIWFGGGILLEIYARSLGMYDAYFKNINPYIWDTAKSTKNVEKTKVIKTVLFINFTPLNFAGGAERWMLDVSAAINKLEDITLLDVHSSIANIYGKLVLKREYTPRVAIDKSIPHHSLTMSSFIPFTSSWKKARMAFINARLIYIRFEILETVLVLYFGGFSAFKRTIAGIHSPFVYAQPLSFFDKLHNFVYTSKICRWILSKMHKIHVLNPSDKEFFTKVFHLPNVVRVPNYIKIEKETKIKNLKKEANLNIAYVGELSMRKGADILIKTIKKSPNNFVFHIAGDGPMRKEIRKLSSRRNVHTHGYLQNEKLNALYRKCDILFMPSRAESFSLVSLEGMSHGLPIVSSPQTHIGLPPFVQQINNKENIEEYINLFTNLYITKSERKLPNQKNKIKNFTQKNFSHEVIMPQLFKNIFEIKDK